MGLSKISNFKFQISNVKNIIGHWIFDIGHSSQREVGQSYLFLLLIAGFFILFSVTFMDRFLYSEQTQIAKTYPKESVFYAGNFEEDEEAGCFDEDDTGCIGDEEGDDIESSTLATAD